MLNVDQIRKDFPILTRKIGNNNLVYFDNAATSQKPIQVLAAMDDFYKNHNANIHRGIHTLSQEATNMVDDARETIANFIGANSTKEIIFVRNATEAINLVMYTWADVNIHEGDVVVVSMLEHHSNFVPWQVLCKKKKAELRIIDINEDGSLNEQSLKSLLDRKVKLVALTHVSNVLGQINDVAKIAKSVHDRSPQAKILIDGSQAIPHIKVTVRELGVDFYVFSGHKMLGPTGIGVLWGKTDILEEMSPFIYGGDMISEVTMEDSSWNELPYKFEGGTPNIAGAIGLASAAAYLSALSMEKVEQYERELTNYALDKLAKYQAEGWLQIYGPQNAQNRVGVISFNIDGVHAHDTAQVLDNFGIAVRSGHHCAAPLIKRLNTPATARVSFYIYNTKEEIDFWVEKLAKVKEVFR